MLLMKYRSKIVQRTSNLMRLYPKLRTILMNKIRNKKFKSKL